MSDRQSDREIPHIIEHIENGDYELALNMLRTLHERDKIDKRKVNNDTSRD